MSRIFLLSLCFFFNCLMSVFAASQVYSLDFNDAAFTRQILVYKNKKMTIRRYEKIVYVSNPVDTAVQQMNIYIPEEYFKGKKINGYSARTAPVFFPNAIGGYMAAKPLSLNGRRGVFPGQAPDAPPSELGQPPVATLPVAGATLVSAGANNENVSVLVVALSKGYVVASAGARGRQSVAQNGQFTGKAPAAIVDLKAAIRYLKYNDLDMPGDATRIISNGTSAGGAMSALLGATGNNQDFTPYLLALGAAPAKDDIFAVSAYCPITNLDHADMAYEWQFYGFNDYSGHSAGFQKVALPASLSDSQQSLSAILKNAFPAYVNGLALKDSAGKMLQLNNVGEGTFKEYIQSLLLASAQKALAEGMSVARFAQLTIKNNQVIAVDWKGQLKYMGRMKTPGAFDAPDLSSAENQVFGDSVTDRKHFTQLYENTSAQAHSMADTLLVRMMNPMNYIGDKQTKTAPHWRIRHGSNDKDTGLAVSAILAAYLQNRGYEVDFAFAWDKPHSGDYDPDELFAWCERICR